MMSHTCVIKMQVHLAINWTSWHEIYQVKLWIVLCSFCFSTHVAEHRFCRISYVSVVSTLNF